MQYYFIISCSQITIYCGLERVGLPSFITYVSQEEYFVFCWLSVVKIWIL